MLFEPFTLKKTTFKNRIVLPPMCMYQADEEGHANDFHVIHYGSMALGGPGLILVEATAVSPNGKISSNDLGIWSDDHIEGLKRISDAIRKQGSIPGIQINHAGRKSKTEEPWAPSALAFDGNHLVPKEMTIDDINETIMAFQKAAQRANQAGFDVLEIHAAHGYLIYQFLSPLTNQRVDRYQNHGQFLVDITEAISNVWPKDKVLAVRISATEYAQGGVTPTMASAVLNRLKAFGMDLIDVSSGGNQIVKIPIYPGYQLGLAKIIKEETGLPVIGGGLIEHLTMAEYAVSAQQCDFVYLGRALLRNPHLILNQAKEVGYDIAYPEPYQRGKK